LDYADEWLEGIPTSSIESFAGTGNPFRLGDLKPGEWVVDIGSGAGMDSLIAARMVEPSGQVVGIDMTPEMVNKARQAAAEAGIGNVEWRLPDAPDDLWPDAGGAGHRPQCGCRFSCLVPPDGTPICRKTGEPLPDSTAEIENNQLSRQNAKKGAKSNQMKPVMIHNTHGKDDVERASLAFVVVVNEGEDLGLSVGKGGARCPPARWLGP
jgi:SAM-dependent methyltransferase